MSISVMPFSLASPIPMLGRPLDWQRMCQETRHLPKDGPGQSEQRPVVAAGLGHCGTGMTPKGKGGRKEKRGRGVRSLLARVSDVWTHGGGGLLSPTRAAPPRVGIVSSLIGRGQSDGLSGAVAGARDRGPRGCDWFFFGGDHFFPLAVLVDSIEASPVCVCDAGRQLGLCAAIRRARAASWQGLKTGRR